MDHKLHTSTVKAKDRKNAILSGSFPITAEFHLCLSDSHISYSTLALILVVPLYIWMNSTGDPLLIKQSMVLWFYQIHIIQTME